MRTNIVYSLRSRNVTRNPRLIEKAKSVSVHSFRRKPRLLLDGFEVTRRNKSSGKPKVRTKLQRLSLELEAAKTEKSVVKLFVVPHIMAGSSGSGGSRSAIAAGSASSISLGSVSVPPTVITSTSLPDPCKQALLVHLPKVSKYAANIRQSLNSQKQYTGEGTYDDFHNFRQALVIGIKSVCALKYAYVLRKSPSRVMNILRRPMTSYIKSFGACARPKRNVSSPLLRRIVMVAERF